MHSWQVKDLGILAEYFEKIWEETPDPKPFASFSGWHSVYAGFTPPQDNPPEAFGVLALGPEEIIPGYSGPEGELHSDLWREVRLDVRLYMRQPSIQAWGGVFDRIQEEMQVSVPDGYDFNPQTFRVIPPEGQSPTFPSYVAVGARITYNTAGSSSTTQEV